MLAFLAWALYNIAMGHATNRFLSGSLGVGVELHM